MGHKQVMWCARVPQGPLTESEDLSAEGVAAVSTRCWDSCLCFAWRSLPDTLSEERA